MFKARAALLGLLALFIASGIAASTASAAGPYWHVNGSKLGQGVAKQVKLQLKGTAVLKGEVSGAVVVIECKNSISEGATIEGQGNVQGQDKGRLTFTQCTVVKPTNCTVVEPITTVQTKSHLVYLPENKQQKFGELFEPQQGETFVTLKFAGKTCLLPATNVKGTVAAEVLPIEAEGQEGLLNFPETQIEKVVLEQQTRKIGLFLGEKATVFSAAYGARLETGEKWGVFGQ